MGAGSLTTAETRQSTSETSKLGPWLSRPLWAEVDLDAIRANTVALKARAGDAELMAMVKANAYGHGAVAVSRAVLQAGASRLGVATLDEAVQLRRAGVTSPILVVGHVSPLQADLAVQLDITLTVNSQQLGLALSSAANEAGKYARVHVKVDTGLNRYGLQEAEVVDLASTLRELPGLEIEGIYTHFATADETDKSFTREQVERFTATADQLSWIPLRHCSNSAGVIDLPEYSFNLVRAGISTYGLYPSEETGREVALTPALTLKARIVRVHSMAPGETTSYGRRWRANGGERVALVPCGYGDGYPRLLSNQFHVLAGGRLCPIRGTIAMDQMMVDITAGTVAEGDEVVVLGGVEGTGVAAAEVAAQAATISYEITTSIATRVPRVFIEGGRAVSVQGLNDPFPVSLEP